MGSVTESAEFGSTFQSEFLVPGFAVPAVGNWIRKRILQKRRFAIVSENQGVYCQFDLPLFFISEKYPDAEDPGSSLNLRESEGEFILEVVFPRTSQ